MMRKQVEGDREPAFELTCLLARAARPRLADDLLADLARQASSISDWATLLRLAEHHGVGPLFLTHLTAAHFDPPRWVTRRLHADLIRQRHANQTRFAALADILDAFAVAGVQVVLLKGAALAPLVYEDVGLRRMNDLDLLVRASQAATAQRLLGKMGFDAPPPPPGSSGHHLPPAVRWIDDVPVQVEIHRNAFKAHAGTSLELEQHPPELLPFTVEGRPAHTLAPAELLWHLCRHLTLPFDEFRLISLADVVGTVQRFEGQIDWDRVARQYPFVLHTLDLLECVVPVRSRAGRAREGPSAADGRLRGLATRYAGWPTTSARQLPNAREALRVIDATIAPPEWWVRLSYGTGAGPAGAWIGRLRHARFVIGLAARRSGELLTARASHGRPPD